MNSENFVVTPSCARRMIQKAHQTIDYSDLEYLPQRKGSGDSLTSQRSLESQQSSDSHSSVTVSFQLFFFVSVRVYHFIGKGTKQSRRAIGREAVVINKYNQ